MRSPLQTGSADQEQGRKFLVVDEVASTQDVAAELLACGEPVAVVLAKRQTGGRGRFGRAWLTGEGDSLTASLVFASYADHPAPHLIGMTLAVAAADVVGCRLRWPNDLVFGERKVGGILTELHPDTAGRRVPVVGIGVNLTQRSFSKELSGIATSLAIEHEEHQIAAERPPAPEPPALLNAVLARLDELPEPKDWATLAPFWMPYDSTPGKRYRLADGRGAVAVGVGPEGQLLCAVEGMTTSVMAATAMFG